MSEILARPVWGTTTWGNVTTSRLYQQSSVEFGEKICKLKPKIKLRFILLWRRQRHRRSYVYCVFGSFNAQCWARRLELRYNGYFEKVQNTICDLPRPGDSANKGVSTSVCSWSPSVRNSAITRWNASGSIASYILLKTRIFRWVENDETPQLTKNGKSITCIMDNSVLLVVSRLSSNSSSILSSTSRIKDHSNYSGKLCLLSDPVQTRSDKHACGKPMLTDHGKQATRNREPANEMNKGDPTQGIPVRL